MNDRYTVITGGPGSGKTTLLEALAAKGFDCRPEGGRAVIRAQTAIDGPALPWRDRHRFAEQLLGWDLRSHAEAAGTGTGPVFFDRGVVDIIGYLRLEGLPVPAHLDRAARRLRYHRRVFVAPHWPGIYRRDAQRRQDAELAERTCRVVTAAYRDYGYRPVALPRTGVAARVEWLLDRLRDNGPD